MPTLDRFRQAETDANRVRKLNLITDRITAAAQAGAASTVTGVTVDETASGAIRTVLTLKNVTVAMTDATTAGCHGSLKLYDFPACNLLYLGATADLTVSTSGEGGIDDAAELVAAVGTSTVGVDNATLTSTEADLIASTAATLTAGAGTADGKSLTAGIAVFDGTGTAKDAWLNFAVPDSGSTADDTITVSGTITIVWANLGDV
ncbi:hypothetical protein D3C75_686780 [compost metagenome]